MRTKKTWSRTLSMLMALVMLMGTMTVMLSTNVFAADANKQLSVKHVDPSLMTIDGGVTEGEPWEQSDWKYFKEYDEQTKATDDDRFKLLWGDEYVYVLIEFVDSNGTYDSTGDWKTDGFLLYIDESGTVNNTTLGKNLDADGLDYTWRTGTCTTEDTGSKANSTNTEYRVDRRNPDGTDNDNGSGALVRIEAKMTCKTYFKDNFGFDLRIQPRANDTTVQINACKTNQCETFITCTREGNVKRADGLVQLDGNVEGAWSYADTYKLFKYAEDSNNPYGGKNHTVKVLWGMEDKAYVYMLLTINNPDTTASDTAQFIAAVDETGTASGNVDSQKTAGLPVNRTGNTTIDVSKTSVSGNSNNIEYAATVGANENNSRTVTVEIKIPMTSMSTAEAAIGKVIGLNIKGSTNAKHEATLNGGDWGNEMEDFIKFRLSDERVAIDELEVTLMNGHTNTQIGEKIKVAMGSEYALPTVEFENGNPLLGWIVGQDLLPAGAKITVIENTTIYAYSIGFKMQAGAQVRLTETTGMRWMTYLDKANLPFNTNIVAMGTLIVPEDYLHKKADGTAEDIEFTHKGLEAAGRLKNAENGYLDVEAEKFVDENYRYKDAPEGWEQINGSIGNIKEANYDRDFAAVGYIKVKYSNTTELYIYADYSGCIRNVSYVANEELKDAEAVASYTDAELAVLNKFAGKQ